MKKEDLKRYLAERLSLEQIAARVHRHPSTVSYHLKKHGLKAVNHDANAPRGSRITREQLESLLGEGASLSELAAELCLSVSSVRYWLRKHGLQASRTNRARAETAAARRAGLTSIERECRQHGHTTFVLESRGYYRCAKCRSGAVSRWRRAVKRRLAVAAGGRCAICGYDRYQGALQFHHLDPTEKAFIISRSGVTRNFAELEAEAAKCILLCANCHAEVEAEVTDLPRSDSGATVIAPVDSE